MASSSTVNPSYPSVQLQVRRSENNRAWADSSSSQGTSFSTTPVHTIGTLSPPLIEANPPSSRDATFMPPRSRRASSGRDSMRLMPPLSGNSGSVAITVNPPLSPTGASSSSSSSSVNLAITSANPRASGNFGTTVATVNPVPMSMPMSAGVGRPISERERAFLRAEKRKQVSARPDVLNRHAQSHVAPTAHLSTHLAKYYLNAVNSAQPLETGYAPYLSPSASAYQTTAAPAAPSPSPRLSNPNIVADTTANADPSAGKRMGWLARTGSMLMLAPADKVKELEKDKDKDKDGSADTTLSPHHSPNQSNSHMQPSSNQISASVPPPHNPNPNQVVPIRLGADGVMESVSVGPPPARQRLTSLYTGSELVNMSVLNRWQLAFVDPSLERDFRREFAYETLGHVAMPLALFAYLALYSFLMDFHVFGTSPATTTSAWVLDLIATIIALLSLSFLSLRHRYLLSLSPSSSSSSASAPSCLSSLASLLSCILRPTARWGLGTVQRFMGSSMLIAGVLFCAASLTAETHSSVLFPDYSSAPLHRLLAVLLLLHACGMHLFVPLVLMSAVVVALFVGLSIGLWCAQQDASSPYFHQLLLQLCHAVVACVVLCVWTYLSERHRRKSYLLHRLCEHERKQFRTENAQLRQTIFEMVLDKHDIEDVTRSNPNPSANVPGANSSSANVPLPSSAVPSAASAPRGPGAGQMAAPSAYSSGVGMMHTGTSQRYRGSISTNTFAHTPTNFAADSSNPNLSLSGPITTPMPSSGPSPSASVPSSPSPAAPSSSSALIVTKPCSICKEKDYDTCIDPLHHQEFSDTPLYTAQLPLPAIDSSNNHNNNHNNHNNHVLDLESPLEKALNMLKALLADTTLSQEHFMTITQVVSFLVSSDLFHPVHYEILQHAPHTTTHPSAARLKPSTLDEETYAWLTGLIDELSSMSLVSPTPNVGGGGVANGRSSGSSRASGGGAFVPVPLASASSPSVPVSVSASPSPHSQDLGVVSATKLSLHAVVEHSHSQSNLESSASSTTSSVAHSRSQSQQITGDEDDNEKEKEDKEESSQDQTPSTTALATTTTIEVDDEATAGVRYYQRQRVVGGVALPKAMEQDKEHKWVRVLQSTELWDFDVFEVLNLTQGQPLIYISIALFKKYDLIARFRIEPRKLRQFLLAVEDGYQDNPYHNSTHAADVLRTVHYFISHHTRRYLSDWEILSSLVAAIIHDFDHPGLTNQFLINTREHRAVLYNDRAVLENYHLSQAFMLLAQPEMNIFENLTTAEYLDVRRMTVDLVLTTDLKQHFEFLTHFKSTNLPSSPPEVIHTPASRLLMMKMSLKCADVGHTAKSLPLHLKWTERVIEEFYRQGDEERRLGLPISPFMDRQKANVPAAQIGFIEFLVIPMYEEWMRCLHMPPAILPPSPSTASPPVLLASSSTSSSSSATSTATAGLAINPHAKAPPAQAVDLPCLDLLKLNRKHWKDLEAEEKSREKVTEHKKQHQPSVPEEDEDDGADEEDDDVLLDEAATHLNLNLNLSKDSVKGDGSKSKDNQSPSHDAERHNLSSPLSQVKVLSPASSLSTASITSLSTRSTTRRSRLNSRMTSNKPFPSNLFIPPSSASSDSASSSNSSPSSAFTAKASTALSHDRRKSLTNTFYLSQALLHADEEDGFITIDDETKRELERDRERARERRKSTPMILPQLRRSASVSVSYSMWHGGDDSKDKDEVGSGSLIGDGLLNGSGPASSSSSTYRSRGNSRASSRRTTYNGLVTLSSIAAAQNARASPPPTSASSSSSPALTSALATPTLSPSTHGDLVDEGVRLVSSPSPPSLSLDIAAVAASASSSSSSSSLPSSRVPRQ